MRFLPSIKPRERRLLKIILKFAKKKKVKLYIVGGYLRDMFLNRYRQNPDIDFCLRTGAISFTKKLSREIKAGFVVLDRERGACRAVKKIKDTVYTLDFTDFRGKNLDEDLRHRDFTINTLSVELGKILGKESPEHYLIDLYRGKQDLKSNIIRMVNRKVFDEDPLRILRSFSFSCLLGFNIDKETLKIIKSKKNRLSQVSSERIRDELFKILDRPDAFRYLVELDKLKILKLIIPEIEIMRNIKQGPYHHLDVWQHTLETVKQLEDLIRELENNKNIMGYLDEVISSGRSRRSLLKLGALLHDIGKPKAMRQEDGKTKFHGHERIGMEFTENIVERLRLSNDELDSLKKIVFWHLRPGYLADNEDITPRAIFRYFRDTAQEGLSILLISIADQRATKGPLASKASRLHHEKVVLDLIKRYFRNKKEKKMPRLITGNDLMEKFRLEPSPLLGKILSEVEELQAIGKIKTKKQALETSRKMVFSKKLKHD